VGKAWASLSLGDLRSAQGDRAGAEALFAAQYDHPTAEVALDARVRQARLHMQNSELDAALTLLAPLDAAPLGADWDASLIEARAMARLMGGDRAGAAAEWSALVARHPGEPEAQLPAWLGLARTFHAGGDGPLAASFLSRLRGAIDGALAALPLRAPRAAALDLCATLIDGISASVLVEPAAWPAERQRATVDALLSALVAGPAGKVQHDVV
jgi:hypothetical protein